MTANVIRLKVKVRAEKKPRPARAPSRKRWLDLLRAESQRRAWTGYSLSEKTPLIDLARAAAYSTKRSITWNGIRFPLRHGLWLVVLDPETGTPLISTSGGMV